MMKEDSPSRRVSIITTILYRDMVNKMNWNSYSEERNRKEVYFPSGDMSKEQVHILRTLFSFLIVHKWSIITEELLETK